MPYIQFCILAVACKMDYIEYLLRKWEVSSLFLTTQARSTWTNEGMDVRVRESIGIGVW